jgi:hypothetical protein
MLFSGAGGGFIFLAVVVAFVAFLVDATAVTGRAGRKQRDHISSFPPMVELSRQGWRRGERPLEVISG